MERAGVPRQRAMLISGHKTESTYERYNITSREDLEQAAVQVQRYLDTLPVERWTGGVDQDDDRRITLVRPNGEKIILGEDASDKFRELLTTRHPGWLELPHKEQEKLVSALLIELLRDFDKLPDPKAQVERFVLERMLSLPPKEPGS